MATKTKKIATKATKKVAAKKAITKKVVAKKTAKKAVAKPIVKKATTKKIVAKKTKVVKPIAKKATTKKVAAKKTVKKAVAKPIAKKTTTKKTAAKKTKVVKPAVKKVVKKAAAKPIAKKVTTKKVAAKKTKVVKPAVKKVVKKAVAKPIAKKVPTKKVAAKTTILSKSVKPAPKDNNQRIEPTKIVRYSDADLEIFRQNILNKLQKAREDYDLLKETSSHGGDNEIDDASPLLQNLEESASTQSKEETNKLAERLKKLISNLEAALIRVENKTYGVCRETGKLIPKERLMVAPHATLSVEAKNKR